MLWTLYFEITSYYVFVADYFNKCMQMIVKRQSVHA